MKIEQGHIDQIKKQFTELQGKEDLVRLLSDARKMLYGMECKPVQLKSLTYYANPEICKKRYQSFTIKKKSGADRTIHAPVRGLKSILRSLNFVLQCMYEPHGAATGFVLGKSIVDNAKKHVGHHYVLNLDLKDFFHTFDRNRVKMGFMYDPFNLNGDKEPLAFLLASLCTHSFEIDGEKRTVLPQGSPTSPTITNLLCKTLDRRLNGLAKRFGAVYTRYADDITFSSPHNIYNDEEFNKELKRIIEEDQKLAINPKKTRLQKAGYRQEATGLIVNEKVNVRRKYVKQIRMWLSYWEKYGHEKAEQIFRKDYIADKGHIKKGKPYLAKVLDGKLEFIKMVKGVEDGTYRGLKKRFHKLISTNINVKTTRTSEETKKLIENKINRNRKDNLDTFYPILHFPKKTVDLLRYFTANDKDLKYSTHSWEEGKYINFEDYIKKITKEWNTIGKELKKQSIRLNAKISNFLFNDRLGQKDENGYYISWGEKNLKFGWSSPELKMHMKETGNSPFSCLIPERIRELDKKHNLYHFRDYAEVFKNEIEFREDSNNFKKMILDLWENDLSYDFEIEGIENLVGFSLFTDVHVIKEVLKTIFRDMFKKRPDFPKVLVEKISNFEGSGFHLIRITQRDSFVSRQVNDQKFTTPSGDLSKIITSLKNLADYSLVSKFGDNYQYRINYLATNRKPFIEDLSNNKEIFGFTHEIKFYL